MKWHLVSGEDLQGPWCDFFSNEYTRRLKLAQIFCSKRQGKRSNFTLSKFNVHLFKQLGSGLRNKILAIKASRSSVSLFLLPFGLPRLHLAWIFNKRPAPLPQGRFFKA